MFFNDIQPHFQELAELKATKHMTFLTCFHRIPKFLPVVINAYNLDSVVLKTFTASEERCLTIPESKH